MDAVTLINGDKDDPAVAQALRAAGIAGPVAAVAADEVARCAERAVAEGARLVIVGGGDGTVSAAAGALAGTGAALGILPLGTLNHFARDLGLPVDLSEAAAAIAGGRVRAVDVAEVNGRVFVNNAAVGIYPLMLVDREAQEQKLGRSKRLAMLVASLRTMARFHEHRLRLSADGGEERVDTPLLFVGNNAYHLSLPAAGSRDSLDAGQLSVMVMRSKGLPGFLLATLRALTGLSRADDMERLDGVTELEVDSALPSLTLAIDGESATLQPPLSFRIRPKALRVIAPA